MTLLNKLRLSGPLRPSGLGRWLLIPLFLVACSASAQTADASAYVALMEAYADVYGFSGSVLVIEGGKHSFSDSSGLANRSFNVSHTMDTRISINSVSKLFTVVALLQLVDEGELELDASIGSYLPALTADWRQDVSVRHLLTHSSGLPREAGMPAHTDLSLAEQLPIVDALDLLHPPGTRYEYSNAGTVLLGRLLETLTGMDYPRVIESRIIEPLGLNNTGVYRGTSVVSRQAVPYSLGPEGVVEAQRSKIVGESAGGGLYSTPRDLYRFVLATEDGSLLSPASETLMVTPQPEVEGGETEAMTWSIQIDGESVLRMAAGSGYGTKSIVLRIPDSDSFIAIMTNWGNTPILDMLRDVYLTMSGVEVNLPDSSSLASPADFRTRLGRYRFDEERLRIHLQMENPVVSLLAVDDRLFLNDELMKNQGDGMLGLTYTNELEISFEENSMVLVINGNRLEGERIDAP